jgi:hypothetical protein
MKNKYVSFKSGDIVNGFKIIQRNGLTEYTATDGRIIICFRTDSGSGRNYSKVNWYTDIDSKRQYRSPRLLIKYVRTVCDISYELLKKWRKENNIEV